MNTSMMTQPKKPTKTKQPSEIGRNIRYYRELLGLTQEELGIKIGLPKNQAQSRISDWESGERTPKKYLPKFCEALHVSEARLRGFTKSTDEEILDIFHRMQEKGLAQEMIEWALWKLNRK